MMLLWMVSGVSLAVAVASWIRARRTARRLEQLSQMYWELRYELGELRVQVERGTGGEPRALVQDPDGRRAEGGTAFVPLTTLKRG
jgi:hypothetical protein